MWLPVKILPHLENLRLVVRIMLERGHHMFNKSTYVTNFGFDFQTNAVIDLMFDRFEDMKAIKHEGNYEDIDNGRMV